MRVCVAALALVSATFGAIPTGSAQPTAQTRARALFERGLILAEEGRRAEAAEAFRASLEIVPRASTALNLAIVLEELGRSREALLALDTVGAEGSGATDQDRQDAERLRGTLGGQLATLTLTVDPPHASLEIDGRADGSAGPTRIVVMDPGPHVLRVVAEGFAPVELNISAVAGAEPMDIVRLTPVAEPPTAAETAAEAMESDAADAEPLAADPDEHRVRRRRWLGGISAAVVAVAAVVLAVTLSSGASDPDAGTTGHIFDPR